MLEPDSRAILLDELRPPEGFRLDAAVATTFTLSLVAAVVPPLAFASSQLQNTSDPIAALQAIRSSADRMDVFCQVGMIRVPASAPDLVAFLEPMVHEVKAPRPGHLFHPKIWALRFVNDEGVTSHRLVVLTRNLTSDHTWDLTLRLDGQVRGGPKALNRPIADLIRTLPDLVVHAPLPSARRSRIDALAEEFRRIEWENPEDVRLEAFHVFGIPRVNSKPDFSGYKQLVISPFATDDGLGIVTGNGAQDITVVSRAHDLDRLSPEWAESINSFLLTGSANLDDEDETLADPESLAGLHAKVYVTERNRRAYIFIGSANTTGPAFNGNVEVLVELSGGASKVGVDRILGEAGDKGSLISMLEPYQAAGGLLESERQKAQHELENVVRAIAEVSHIVSVDSAQSAYELTVTTNKAVPLPDGYAASLHLLTVPGRAHHLKSAAPVHTAFRDVDMADITPFLVWEVTSPAKIPPLGTVVRAELRNEPAGRLDEILARQVDTPEKFFRFLSLLLGFDSSDTANDGGNEAATDSAGLAFFGGGGPGVFEMVLRALVDRPDSITDLDGFVTRLESTEQGRKIAGDAFLRLWQTVRMAAGIPTDGGA